MRCGNCKSSGPEITVAQIRDCSAGVNNPHPLSGPPVIPTHAAVKSGAEPMSPASEKQITYALGLLAERTLPQGYVAKTEAQIRSMERPDVSAMITFLRDLPRAQGSKGGNYTMPAGRYALDMPSTVPGVKSVWRFFEVSKPTEGRWAGYTFIKRLRGAPGTYAKDDMSLAQRVKVLALIEADPKQAMLDYGIQSNECGRCSSPLTDTESRARGIGPKCAKKSGWF